MTQKDIQKAQVCVLFDWEWQELEQYVREHVSQTVREIMTSEKVPAGQETEREPLAHDTGNGNLKW